VGAVVGFAIGQAFDGTVAPLAVGTLVCSVAALGVVAWAERCRLLQPGQAAEVEGPEPLLEGGRR
jgi:DHA1 family bicyclomycin/chloramphenicol resistance-like MFS transporter